MSETRKNWILIPFYINQISDHSLFSRHMKDLKPADGTEEGDLMSCNPGSHWCIAVCASRHIIVLDSKETSGKVKGTKLVPIYEV